MFERDDEERIQILTGRVRVLIITHNWSHIPSLYYLYQSQLKCPRTSFYDCKFVHYILNLCEVGTPTSSTTIHSWIFISEMLWSIRIPTYMD